MEQVKERDPSLFARDTATQRLLGDAWQSLRTGKLASAIDRLDKIRGVSGAMDNESFCRAEQLAIVLRTGTLPSNEMEKPGIISDVLVAQLGMLQVGETLRGLVGYKKREIQIMNGVTFVRQFLDGLSNPTEDFIDGLPIDQLRAVIDVLSKDATQINPRRQIESIADLLGVELEQPSRARRLASRALEMLQLVTN